MIKQNNKAYLRPTGTFFRKVKFFATLVLLLLLSGLASAAESGGSHGIDGSDLSLLWALPFAGILLSIAIFPLVAEDWWHHNFGKVSAAWGLLLVIPLIITFGFDAALYEVLHAYLLEYIPFIVLLLALFTVSGGIRIKGYLKGTPEVNTGILLLGTILASWMGTTGAAMLLIRPILRANEWRSSKKHIVIFFIFLVANVGGSLTPLGDPPLFLGFLQGVDFFWTTTNLFWEMTFVAVILLILYYFWDRHLYNKETNTAPVDDGSEPLGIEGSQNLLLIVAIVGAVLFSGLVHVGELTIYHVHVNIENLIRDGALLLITWLSWIITSKASRAANGFNWFPIQEVAKLFAGIFITIIAPIAMLKAANNGEGALQFVNNAVFDASGEPINYMFFWITGMLSAFLDNAPTYLVFFNAAGGDAQILMNEMSRTLIAISSGAVFFGALSYIGNAPNFMVKSIAEQNGVKMPSFGAYLIWSIGILVPIYLLVTFLFI
ncbi:MAG: sodium:proton antiporter [Balneolaceae bacterium]|nr:sodium:proton antiporter [Balneolaceae bacterium]MBO6547593.1 sodium:proton antiporter [Balneolaceae bacterium]MBO6648104.1 sodium:proton antiporter [Balneolaceae bacterium]